jgi:hypothetical protein
MGLGLLILFFVALATCDREKAAQRDQAQREQEQRELENLVGRHSFAVGMTKDQVTRALGQPARVNRTVRANSISEQWLYEISGRTISLYIDNGILRSFQDSRLGRRNSPLFEVARVFVRLDHVACIIAHANHGAM